MVEISYKNMSSTTKKACLVTGATKYEQKHLMGPLLPGDGQLAETTNQTAPMTGSKPMTSYHLSADEPWPDQGLNRFLTAVDNFNTNELSEVECLEMLFYLSSRRRDARSLAESAIQIYGSLASVFQRPGKELREALGIDHAMSALLAIAKSSMKRILAPDLSARQEIESFAALMNYLALDLRGNEQEVFRVIYLDTKCRIIKDEEMARGTVDAVTVYPKEVAKRAAGYCASSVILAHNHLGDDPTPSRNDIAVTIQTKGALKLFDVTLHDHVIVARNCYFSMHKEGLV